MNKYLVSFVFVLLLAGYAVIQYFSNNSTVVYATNNPTPSQPIADSKGTTVQSAPPPNLTPTPIKTTPAPRPQGQYADGAYTGKTEDAYYGLVQVRATISNGKITDVRFLQYPNDRSTSRFINQQAMPILSQEAIRSQSANVDGVSGASDTSAAFRQSLASALSQARS